MPSEALPDAGPADAVAPAPETLAEADVDELEPQAAMSSESPAVAARPLAVSAARRSKVRRETSVWPACAARRDGAES